MQNPFPGMNPYLEQSGLWPQVHNRLIVAMADAITPQVAPKYRVSIEERIYTTTDPLPLVGIADVSVMRRQESVPAANSATQLSEPRRVQVPMPIEITERFLEVRLVQTNAVVCVIELLSPTNKRSGEGRTAYLTKCDKILGSGTHLVEIDLLRGGEPMPMTEPSLKPYRILVSRSPERPYAELYEWALPEPIPPLPIPLRDRDPEPVVDVQQLLNEIYTRARLDLAIDYTQPLKPTPSEAEATWVTSLLTE